MPGKKRCNVLESCFIKYEVVRSTYLFFKGGALRSVVTDPFPLSDAISSSLPFPFYSSHTIVTFIFSPIRSIPLCISFRCLTPTCRFLRHRPCSMSICIIYFVSDSSGSSWQPAIFGTTCSIDLIASAKTEFERDSLQLKWKTFNYYIQH